MTQKAFVEDLISGFPIINGAMGFADHTRSRCG
jgi:hypothetical protein